MKASETRPEMSVIISSLNRAPSLLRCLSYFDAAAMQQHNAELVLVDNGSSDRTFEIMTDFRNQADFPVIVARENRHGLSNARNTGLALSRGDLVVFTDDDCYIAPDFLKTIKEVFRTKPIDYCGGRILLFDEFDSAYGCDFSPIFRMIPPRTFLAPGAIQGANMIFRRAVTDRVGDFDTSLGAGTPFRCEDIDYCTRASWAGFVGAHVPDLVVYHHHGRKPGKDVTELQRANQYAEGAYYAKCFFSGILSARRCFWILAEQFSRISSRTRGAFAFTLALASRRFHTKPSSSEIVRLTLQNQMPKPRSNFIL